MICDVGASIQRDGHAGGGALVEGTVRQGAQKKPGQLTDVGYALNEFFWPKEIKKKKLKSSLTNYLTIQHLHLLFSYLTLTQANLADI